MKTAVSFLKENMMFTVAFAAALVTSVIVPPDKAYLSYFDLKTFSCLFCVLAVVCALKNINFFYMLAENIVRKFGNLRNGELSPVGNICRILCVLRKHGSDRCS